MRADPMGARIASSSTHSFQLSFGALKGFDMPVFVELPGNRRPRKSSAHRLGDIPQDEPLELTIGLAGKPLSNADDLGLEAQAPDDVRAAYAASPEEAAKVANVLKSFGFQILEVSMETRSIRILGTVAEAEAAFKPKLALFHSADQGDFRGREGDLYIPEELSGLVTGVFGLDERKVARRKSSTHEAVAAVAPAAAAGSAAASAPKWPVRPEDVESWYNFPAGDGAGREIVIAEFGGGYFDQDLSAYCTKMGRPKPRVTAYGFGRPAYTLQDVMGMPADQRNAELGASGEVMMDVQIIAGLCPAAELFVYFAPFTQKGWVDLLNAVIKGTPAANPVAVSISWGGAEDDPEQLTPATLHAIEDKLNTLAHMGITVCVSSGDDGSGDQVSDGAAHTDYPASSAFALGVGGTEFSSTDREVVWWDAPGRRTGTKKGGGATGGGVSTVWTRPAWQTVHVTSLNPGSIDGRVVPDITALAGQPLYDLIFLGHDAPNGGTSASAPLWASLIARCSAALPASKQRRFLTRLLYAPMADGRPVGAVACRPVTSGDNASSPSPGRGYAATTGFSAVAGWGAPDGKALVDALGKI